MDAISALGVAARLGPPAGTIIAISALVAWAGAGWSLTPTQSHRLVGLVPAAGPEVLSLNTSAVYLGIAAGAAVGGQVLTHLGTAPIGFAAAALQLLALASSRTPEGPRPAPTRQQRPCSPPAQCDVDARLMAKGADPTGPAPAPGFLGL